MKSLAFFFFLISFCSNAQQLTHISSTPLEADTFIGIDSYKNTYFIKEMVLHKQGPLGDFSFRDYQLGPVATIDIINPLNIVVFYEEVNTVVLLDNRLSELQRINFNTLSEFINVSAATNAGNNKLWIFNVDTQQLELYNYRTGVKIVISQPLPETLVSIASDFNYCYLLTSESLRKYNIYGSLLAEQTVDGFEKIIQLNQKIIAVKNNELVYDSGPVLETDLLLNPVKLPIPENNIKDLQLTQDFLYIYNGIDIQTFTLTNPKQ